MIIDGIPNTLTAFPIPIENSINFAKSNRFTYNDSSDEDSDDDMYGYINATTAPQHHDARGRSHKSGSQDDKKTNSGSKRGHKEVDCCIVAQWLIVSKAIKDLPENLRIKILENYYHYYSTKAPSKSISRSCVQQEMSDLCKDRHMTPNQLVHHFNWDGYVNTDLNAEEDGFETAAEDENASE